MQTSTKGLGRVFERMKWRRDKHWDNVCFFFGPEGTGKSNTADQVMFAMDPSYGVHRIAFPQEELFKIVDEAPDGASVLWDEGDLNKRKAMRGDRLDVLDLVQTNRAQRLTFGICFPRGGQADLQALERGGWVFQHKERGLVNVIETWTTEDFDRNGQLQTKLHRKDWGTFRIAENKGPFVRAREAKKRAHMRSQQKRKVGSFVDTDAIAPLVDQVLVHLGR